MLKINVSRNLIFLFRETFLFLRHKQKIMDFTDIELIGKLFNNTVFPIAVCIILFKYITQQNKEMQKTIENNTKVLNELATIIKTFIK